MKQVIKLKESELKRMIAESVNNTLMETAETIGPFVNDRAGFSGLKTKKEQMNSDWNDLRDTYPYGGEIPFDYQDAEEALSNEEDWNMSQYDKPKRIEDYMDESNIHKIVRESIKNIMRNIRTGQYTEAKPHHLYRAGAYTNSLLMLPNLPMLMSSVPHLEIVIRAGVQTV